MSRSDEDPDPPQPPPTPGAPRLDGDDEAREEDRVVLVWNETEGLRYDVRVVGAEGERIVADTRPGSLTGLLPSSTYAIHLRAVAAAVSTWSPPLDTCTRPPRPPVQVEFRSLGDTGTVSWRSAASLVDVELSPLDGPATLLLDAVASSFTALPGASRAWSVRFRAVETHPLAPSQRNESRWSAGKSFVVTAAALTPSSHLPRWSTPTSVSRVLRGRHGR